MVSSHFSARAAAVDGGKLVVGAANLTAAAELVRVDCLRLTRKVSLMSHFIAEAGEGDTTAGTACVCQLLRVLEAAWRFVVLRRAPPTPATVLGPSDQGFFFFGIIYSLR
ncbi:unnamed protein product [Urochloa humidicola]